MEGKIRPIKKSDIPICQQIIYECLDLVCKNKLKNKILKKHYSLKNIEKYTKSSKVFYVFEINNQVLATGRLTKRNELRTLYVDIKYHKKAIGTKMLSELEKYAIKKGIKKLYLHALDSAVRFYLKKGYIKSKDFLIRENKMEKRLV
jgi:N-acetylglutamate synthase-like GNAT family acetyltransferase